MVQTFNVKAAKYHCSQEMRRYSMKLIGYVLIGIVLILPIYCSGQPILSNSSGLSKDVQDYVNSVVTTPLPAPIDDVFLNISLGGGSKASDSVIVELSAKFSFKHPSHSYVAKKSDYLILTKKWKEMKLAPGCGCDECYCIRPVYVENSYLNLKIPLAELSDFDNTIENINVNISLPDFLLYTGTFGNPYYDPRVGAAIDWYTHDAWIKWADNARALFSEGKYEDAIQYCDKSIAANRAGKNAWLLKAGFEDNAWDRNIGQVWAIKGHALKALGRTTEAQAAFAKAKEMDPSYPIYES